MSIALSERDLGHGLSASWKQYEVAEEKAGQIITSLGNYLDNYQGFSGEYTDQHPFLLMAFEPPQDKAEAREARDEFEVTLAELYTRLDEGLQLASERYEGDPSTLEPSDAHTPAQAIYKLFGKVAIAESGALLKITEVRTKSPGETHPTVTVLAAPVPSIDI